MQICARSFLLFGLVFVLTAQGLIAQNEFQILNIDDSNWPTMRAEYLVTDEDGNSLRGVDISEFEITENGQPVLITGRDCPPDPAPTPIDVVLVNDISVSMKGTFDETDELRIQLLKRGALAFIDRLKPSLDPGLAEVAVTAFAPDAYLIQEFTSNELVLRNIINDLEPVPDPLIGTNYEAALNHPNYGAINMLKNRPPRRGTPPQDVKRYIVLLTDGGCFRELVDPCFEPFPLVDTILTYNIDLISIAMGFTMGDSLRTLTNRVDGTIYEEVKKDEEIRAMYSQIAETIQGKLPCSITWQSEVGCEDIDREVVVRYIPYDATDEVKYRPDAAEAVARSTVAPSVLSFGNPDPGQPIERTFKVTIGDNPRGRHTVTDIQLDPPLPHYMITGISVNGAAPQTLADFLAGDGDLPPKAVVEITVEFTQDDDRNFLVSRVVFTSEPCDIRAVTLWGGGARDGGTTVLVEVPPTNSRCDGVEITWFTTPIERRMTLSYRVAGSSDPWVEISDQAANGFYLWTDPPQSQGGVQYEVRAEATGVFADWDWAKDEGGAAEDKLIGVSVDAAGNIYTGGSVTGFVEFGDSEGSGDVDGGYFAARYFSDGTLDRVVESRAIIQGQGRVDLDVVEVAASNNGLYVVGNNVAGSTTNDQPTIRFIDGGNFQVVPNAVRGPMVSNVIESYIDVKAAIGTGNAFVLGVSKSSQVGLDDGLFVEQYDRNLNPIWEFAETNSSAVEVEGVIPSALAVTVDEGVVIVGSVNVTSGADFGGTTVPRGPFVARFDNNATLVWARGLDAGQSIELADVAVNSSGKIFITGSYNGTPRFGSKTLGSIGGTDIFVAQLDDANNGSIDWATRAYSQNTASRNDRTFGIATDLNGDCYVTGVYRGRRLVLENAGGGEVSVSNNSEYDEASPAETFVARFNTSGEVVWANSAGGSRDDIPVNVAVDGSNGVVVGGNHAIDAAGVGVGRPLFGSFRLSQLGRGDMFVAKLRSYTEGEDISEVFTVDAPEPELDPVAPVNFGDVPVAELGQQFPRLFNSGTWPMNIAEWRIEGANPGDFRVDGIPASDAAALQPGDLDNAANLEMFFTPSALGPRTADLVIVADCGDEKIFVLQGNGVDPCKVEDAPDPNIEVGPFEPGITGATTFQDIFCNDKGFDIELKITLTGAGVGMFTITSPNPVTLQPDDCYDLTIQCTPEGEGANGEVLVFFEYGDCLYTSNLTCLGLAGDATILADDFEIGPIICADDDPVTQDLVITNIGSSDLELDNPVISAGTHGFSVDPTFTFPVVVPPSGSVNIPIIFDPPAFGPQSAEITFGGNAANASEPIPLLGAKETVTWSFNPDPVDFGTLSDVEFDGVNNVLDVTITNTGSIAADLDDITVPLPFEILTPPAGQTIAPGGSIVVQVRFNKPGLQELQSGSLELTYDPPCDPASVAVSGFNGSTTVEIDLPELEGDVHDRDFRIPITMIPDDNFSLLADNEAARQFDLTIRIDARLFLTVANQLGSSDCINCTSVTSLEPSVGGDPVDEWRHVTISGTAPAWNVGDGPVNLATVSGIVMLGNMTSTPIEVVSLDWPGVGATTNGGSLTLVGVCEAGGQRLLQRSGVGFGIRSISPNPADGHVQVQLATVETGSHTLEVHDVAGRVVYHTEWNETVGYNAAGQLVPGAEWEAVLDASGLASGVYQIVLRTPTQVARESLVISR